MNLASHVLIVNQQLGCLRVSGYGRCKRGRYRDGEAAGSMQVL